MIIRREVLERIARGEVTLAFRRWRRPTVRAGGTLKTAVGVLAIHAVDVVDEGDVSAVDARRAGYASAVELAKELDNGFGGRIYRIALSLAGPDPRVALREQRIHDLDEERRVLGKLRAMDARSAIGPWTRRTLSLIRDHPETRAAALASEMRMEVLPFKQRVRALKALGLTESLEVGYRLSPRGLDLLRRIGTAGGP